MRSLSSRRTNYLQQYDQEQRQKDRAFKIIEFEEVLNRHQKKIRDLISETPRKKENYFDGSILTSNRSKNTKRNKHKQHQQLILINEAQCENSQQQIEYLNSQPYHQFLEQEGLLNFMKKNRNHNVYLHPKKTYNELRIIEMNQLVKEKQKMIYHLNRKEKEKQRQQLLDNKNKTVSKVKPVQKETKNQSIKKGSLYCNPYLERDTLTVEPVLEQQQEKVVCKCQIEKDNIAAPYIFNNQENIMKPKSIGLLKIDFKLQQPKKQKKLSKTLQKITTNIKKREKKQKQNIYIESPRSTIKTETTQTKSSKSVRRKSKMSVISLLIKTPR